MTALNTERDTPQYNDGPLAVVLSIPMQAATKCYAGGLTCVDATGQAVPGQVSSTLIAVGRCRRTTDNSAGAAAAINVDVERGVFKFDQFATAPGADLITQAMLLTPCYVVDDATVAATNGGGTRSRAGIIVRIEADGVFVQVGA